MRVLQTPVFPFHQTPVDPGPRIELDYSALQAVAITRLAHRGWMHVKDSNPEYFIQSEVCYHYTNMQ